MEYDCAIGSSNIYVENDSSESEKEPQMIGDRNAKSFDVVINLPDTHEFDLVSGLSWEKPQRYVSDSILKRNDISLVDEHGNRLKTIFLEWLLSEPSGSSVKSGNFTILPDEAMTHDAIANWSSTKELEDDVALQAVNRIERARIRGLQRRGTDSRTSPSSGKFPSSTHKRYRRPINDDGEEDEEFESLPEQSKTAKNKSRATHDSKGWASDLESLRIQHEPLIPPALLDDSEYQKQIASRTGERQGDDEVRPTNPFIDSQGRITSPWFSETQEGRYPVEIADEDFASAPEESRGRGITNLPYHSRQASEEPYVDQLRQLNDMGFYESEHNVKALRKSGGKVQRAVEHLLSGDF
ncbi:hypothetical protein BT63DRAFT_201995 [Microthyrium microscopicum]|uniref:UBA domain-containing protein n=1 Tax=Microthyrium microscopicum TaxID=703497 RepID=A0A6A6UG73_9PEZI|nr:hypothetical protein BT63DRAFT_201995 [Microthyrium microscopicum]